MAAGLLTTKGKSCIPSSFLFGGSADVSAENHADLQRAATDKDLLLSDLQRWQFRSRVFFGRILCLRSTGEWGWAGWGSKVYYYFCSPNKRDSVKIEPSLVNGIVLILEGFIAKLTLLSCLS